MKEFIVSRIILVLNILLILFVTLAAAGGTFLPGVYAKETLLWGAQGMGQDIVNLFVIIPVLTITFILARKGVKQAYLIWLGIVVYIVYSFILYSYSVHFNFLFFVYCGALGTSIFLFVTAVHMVTADEVKSWFAKAFNPAGILLIVIGLIFYVLWLKEIIPALMSGQTPKSITDAGIIVNPVHVTDIALCLPAFIMAGVLLLRNYPLGYVFTPAFLSFSACVEIALISMMITMRFKGITNDVNMVPVIAVFVLITVGSLAWFLKGMKGKKNINSK